MPPTDPERPGTGRDFDDAFWDDLADFLEEPPPRPRTTDEAAGEPVVPDGEQAGAPSAAPDPLAGDAVADAGTAEDDSGRDDGAPPDEPPEEHQDGWWDGLWHDESAVEPAPADVGPESEDAPAPPEAIDDAAKEAAEPSDDGDGDGDGVREDPPADPESPGAEFEPFRPGDAPRGGLPSPRRRMSPRTQRRVLVAVVAALVVGVVGLVAPVRDAFSTALRSLGNGTADVTGAAADRWRSWTTELQTVAADLPARQIDEQRQIEGSESLLFIVVDDDDRTVGVALLALAPDGGSTLALLPPSLYDILPGYGDFPLSDATAFEGPELTAITVANVLGVRIDDVATLGPGDLAAAVGSPIEIDLPTALVVDDGDGNQRVLAQSGPGERSAEQVEALMVVRGVSDPLEWLQRQTAVWDGILTAIGSDPGVPSRLAAYAGDETAATGTLARAAAGEHEVTVVPVTRVAAGSDEGFKVSYEDADDFVARRMAHLALRTGERPRVEVLNGNGRVLTTRSVVEALIRRGFRVVKTDNAENFDFEQTLVIAQGREHRADADEAIDALGVGELLLELRAPSGVVDVSIIVGQDIPAGEA